MRYCGRSFTTDELQSIRKLITDNPAATRAHLSRLVCGQLRWRRDNGQLKDMSCRVAMLRMQDDGLLQLPPPRNANNNGKPYLSTLTVSRHMSASIPATTRVSG